VYDTLRVPSSWPSHFLRFVEARKWNANSKLCDLPWTPVTKSTKYVNYSCIHRTSRDIRLAASSLGIQEHNNTVKELSFTVAITDHFTICLLIDNFSTGYLATVLKHGVTVR
jgi:hypothetical protein